MRKRFSVHPDRYAGHADTFYIVDNGKGVVGDDTKFLGTFGEDCAELAKQCAQALNRGATTYFVGVEFRQHTCYLHIKRRDRTCTQSIVERHHGARLLSKLCQRHPLMVVDLFLVFDRCHMHRTYTAKEHIEVSHD